MKKCAYLLVIVVVLLSGCRSMQYQQNCLSNYISSVSTDPEYEIIRNAAKDTVAHWATLNIRTFFAINHMDWKIDSTVIFNEDKTKALLLLLKIDQAEKAKLDHIKLMAAEKIKGKWHFYVQTLPSFYFVRERNPGGRPYTFEELTYLGRYNHIRDGFYKKYTCAEKDSYVEYWFQMPLTNAHQYFLKNRVEK